MTTGLLLDIDGVLVTSWKALPGAVEAVADLADRISGRMFLTNTTSRTREEIADALRDSGFDVDADEILTAAALTAEYLAAHHRDARVWLLNDGDIAADLPDVALVDDPADADVVVLGGAGGPFTHAAVSSVLDALLDGTPVIAMHRSMTWSTAEGMAADTGVYVEGLEKAADRKIPAIGKPSATGFTAAAALLGRERADVVMVGDDMRNDVLGAQAAGLTGVLVRTGKFRLEALDALRDEGDDMPDHVIDSIADLPALLDELSG